MDGMTPELPEIRDEWVEALAQHRWALEMPANPTGRDQAERYAEGVEYWALQTGYWRDRYLGRARADIEFIAPLMWPEAYRAGREDAARNVEAGGAYRVVEVCRYRRSFGSTVCAEHVCVSEAGHGYPWHRCSCGAMYRDDARQIDLGRSSGCGQENTP